MSTARYYKETISSAILKKIAASFPSGLQTELKRLHFGRQIKKNKFIYHEPEYKILHELVKSGDWVIDIGANIGHYTKRLSDLVGTNGRVIAFEPVPRTLSILAANVQLFTNSNVTLINAASSDKVDVVGMSMPDFSSGLANYYEAHLDENSTNNNLSVLTIPLDLLSLNQRISLIKVDVEGHEASALAGMEKTILKYHPTLIVETGSEDIIAKVTSWGYTSTKFENSPNVLFKANE